MRAATLALVAAALAACAVDVPRATLVDVARAEQARPGTTLADLERGRSLYLAKCTNCHRPIAPRSIAPALWPGHVDDMRERSRISTDERASIVLYLTTLAAATPPPK